MHRLMPRPTPGEGGEDDEVRTARHHHQAGRVGEVVRGLRPQRLHVRRGAGRQQDRDPQGRRAAVRVGSRRCTPSTARPSARATATPARTTHRRARSGPSSPSPPARNASTSSGADMGGKRTERRMPKAPGAPEREGSDMGGKRTERHAAEAPHPQRGEEIRWVGKRPSPPSRRAREDQRCLSANASRRVRAPVPDVVRLRRGHQDQAEKSLTKPKPKTGGRNSYGRMTSRHRGGGHKQRYRIVDFRRNKDGVPAKVAAIEYDPNRNARLALLHYLDGEKRYIIAAGTRGRRHGAERSGQRDPRRQRVAAALHPGRHHGAQRRAQAGRRRQDGPRRGHRDPAHRQGRRVRDAALPSTEMRRVPIDCRDGRFGRQQEEGRISRAGLTAPGGWASPPPPRRGEPRPPPPPRRRGKSPAAAPGPRGGSRKAPPPEEARGFF